MYIDLSTIYAFMFASLAVSGALTFWERRFHPLRKDVLAEWALAYAAFTLGCALLIFAIIPTPYQRAPAFLLNLFGYVALLDGVLRLNGGALPLRLRWASLPFAGFCFALFPHLSYETWSLLCSAAIAPICGAATVTLLRGCSFSALRSRKPAVLVFGFHAIFYAARVTLFLASGLMGESLASFPEFFTALAKITMFEGVLFAIAAPMLLLSLVREEGEARILEASNTDYLTGLPNRRALFDRSVRRIQEARSDGASVSVMVFDLDHFKLINDTHGHQTGDDVLKLFAGILDRELRSSDLAARFGGEEFVVLLTGQTREETRELAQRIARAFAVEAARFDGLAINATVSVGLVHCVDADRGFETLLAEADAALYRAKALGRNRVEQAPGLAAVA